MTSSPVEYKLNKKYNKCFIKCTSNYFNPINNECVSGCPKYYEKPSITNNYISKSSCSSTNKYLKGKECVNSAIEEVL